MLELRTKLFTISFFGGILFSQWCFAQSDYYLNLLDVTQNAQSKDYVNNKKQFQLHTLLTEQSHQATADLTVVTKQSLANGALELLTVDHDINKKILSLKQDPETVTNILKAVTAVKNSILHGNRVYVYGTGSTGRLAKQIENFWQAFWADIKSRKDWPTIAQYLSDISNLNNIQKSVFGEITGADRALISSLEGFEDLQLIGQLQLEDHKISNKDVVFAVTEGGETSAVIGTLLAASKLSGSRKDNLYFFYNNPDKLLMPFDRSREVITNANITKINFTTGKQGIMGSTRMQATSSQTFLIATIIEMALAEILHDKLPNALFKELGFGDDLSDITDNLQKFNQVQADIEKELPAIVDVANFEYQAYTAKKRAMYFGSQLLTTLFIDVTERAPTFNLAPLDAKGSPALSWINVSTDASTLDKAWLKLLCRDFQGLEKARYTKAFEVGITDPYLKKVAIASLNKATYDQKYLYDFSLGSFKARSLGTGDIGIAYLMVNEVQGLLEDKSNFRQWLEKLNGHDKMIVLVGFNNQQEEMTAITQQLKKIDPAIQVKFIGLSTSQDPLQSQQKIALKLFLNTQSTLIMSRLERVLGNSMIFVYPSNLKLTGRATYLILVQLNRILANKSKFASFPQIDYSQANAVLFDASGYIERNHKRDQVAIIPLVLVRILESLQGRTTSWADSEKILVNETLNEYIEKL